MGRITWHRVRAVANLVNGSTLAGLAVARIGGARTRVAVADGLLVVGGYRLPVPVAPVFTLGNVIVSRSVLPLAPRLLAHEARHATQYVWCGGVLMVPMYLVAAGASWIACGDFGAWNVFERGAGLADGGYATRPVRWNR